MSAIKLIIRFCVFVPLKFVLLMAEEIQLPSSSRNTKLHGRLTICESPLIAIISHPYGPLGGNSRNHVVCFLENMILGHGISTLCIDMRGSGKSEGRTSWTSNPEKNDLVVVSTFITGLLQSKYNIPSPKVVLCGYSFGSMVSFYAAADIFNLAGVISISYPASVVWALTAFQTQPIYDAFEANHLSSIRKLFIIGEQDNFSSISAWRGLLSQIPDPKDLIVIAGLDHFYTSDTWQEMLKTPIQSFLDAILEEGQE